MIKFSTLLLLIYSFASTAGPSIEIKKQILDYRQSLESDLKSKIESIVEQDIVVNIELETILSSEKINEVSQKLNLSLSTLVSDGNPTVYLQNVNIDINSFEEISFKNKKLIRKLIQKHFVDVTPQLNYRVKNFSLFHYLSKYGPLLLTGVFCLVFIIGLIGVAYKSNQKKKLSASTLSQKEEEELDYMISEIVTKLNYDKDLLLHFVERYHPESIAVKTLMTYLELHFKLSDVLDEVWIQNIKKEKTFYAPKEFKIWLSAYFDDIVNLGEQNVSLATPPPFNCFDFSSIEKASTDELKYAFSKLSKNELLSLIQSVPDNIKFLAFEYARSTEKFPVEELLMQLNTSGLKNYNSEVVDKFIMLVASQMSPHAA